MPLLHLGLVEFTDRPSSNQPSGSCLNSVNNTDDEISSCGHTQNTQVVFSGIAMLLECPVLSDNMESFSCCYQHVCNLDGPSSRSWAATLNVAIRAVLLSKSKSTADNLPAFLVACSLSIAVALSSLLIWRCQLKRHTQSLHFWWVSGLFWFFLGAKKVRSLCEYEVFPLNLGIKQEKESGHRF